MPSGINPSLGCSPITGCTSKDYYIPGKGVWAPKQQNNKARWGAVGGAVMGAYLGKGDPLLSAGGAVVGMLVGYEVGGHFDKVDQIYATMLLKQTLTNNNNGQMSTWSNPNKGVSVTQGPVATNGNCREFISKVTVGKELRNVKGTACFENNEWVMKELYQ
jgi:surface antigen|tara:strand:- start:351 stop:833 length:483 start_codon:yes stop_codon:yes gene_type:complete